MPADPVAAGRKGSRSRSLKKLLAIRKNGFQRVYPRPEATHQPRIIDIIDGDIIEKDAGDYKPLSREEREEIARSLRNFFDDNLSGGGK
jgi:hypothetical protein